MQLFRGNFKQSLGIFHFSAVAFGPSETQNSPDTKLQILQKLFQLKGELCFLSSVFQDRISGIQKNWFQFRTCYNDFRLKISDVTNLNISQQLQHIKQNSSTYSVRNRIVETARIIWILELAPKPSQTGLSMLQKLWLLLQPKSKKQKLWLLLQPKSFWLLLQPNARMLCAASISQSGQQQPSS